MKHTRMIRKFSTLLIIMHTAATLPHSWTVDEMLKHMTTEQKIGQLFIVASNESTYQADGGALFDNCAIDTAYLKQLIRDYQIGGIIFPGKQTMAEQHARIENLQQYSTIPLFIAIDAEWGLGMRISDGINFPLAMTLGAIQDNGLLYAMGLEVGEQCAHIGAHINFAPVADVNNNPDNPIIGRRSFGDSPINVAEKAIHIARGLHDAGIIACAKHFPGHGNTDVDSHKALPTISATRAQLDNMELVPFAHLIQDGIPAIMIGHLAVPSLETDPLKPASLSSEIINGLLRTELNFRGLIITDALRMKGINQETEPGAVAVAALKAGNDILLCPINTPASFQAIQRALESGELSRDKLDMHVRRILEAKQWAFSQQHNPKAGTSINITEELNTDKAYALQQQLYEQAITLFYTNNGILPLDNATTYYCLITDEKGAAPFLEELHAHRPDLLLIDQDALQNLSPQIPIILPILSSMTYRQSLLPEIKELIATIQKQGNPLILVLCASPYLLSQLPKADACIVAYESAKAAQKAAARALSGAISMPGRLPITISHATSC
jgi:beta-N-acetylhexosaminidase